MGGASDLLKGLGRLQLDAEVELTTGLKGTLRKGGLLFLPEGPCGCGILISWCGPWVHQNKGFLGHSVSSLGLWRSNSKPTPSTQSFSPRPKWDPEFQDWLKTPKYRNEMDAPSSAYPKDPKNNHKHSSIEYSLPLNIRFEIKTPSFPNKLVRNKLLTSGFLNIYFSNYQL